jgi:TPR repeat protein
MAMASPRAIDPRSFTARLARMSAPSLQALLSRNAPVAAACVYALAGEGLAQAQLCYGRMLLEGKCVHGNPCSALAWFRRAADQGEVDAINMVGRCLDNGWGIAADPAAAATQYARAGDAGHAWAQYNLGHLYLDGRGVPRDPNRAFGLYRSAACQGHERAMNLLGRCHEEGWGTPRDAAAAARWYRRAAERGYFRGQYNWATVLLHAGRVDEAVIWFECAAGGGTFDVCRAVIEATRGCSAPAARRLAARLASRLAENLPAVATCS